MKVVSICKTLKKKHKSKKKWKKRKLNKSVTKKLSASFSFENIQFTFSKMTGNCFWNNYYGAFQWRNNYLNFWNASSALPQQHLLDIPQNNNVTIGRTIKKCQNKTKLGLCTEDVQECIRDFNCIKLDSNGDSSFSQNENYSSSDLDNASECSTNIEVSEEMIKFMEYNMRHKADLEAEKERLRKLRNKMEIQEKVSERDDIEECKVPTEATANKCRSEEMNTLYGKTAPMIHGMETAIQLTFNWNCDNYKPEYWPILPFKFKFSN